MLGSPEFLSRHAERSVRTRTPLFSTVSCPSRHALPTAVPHRRPRPWPTPSGGRGRTPSWPYRRPLHRGATRKVWVVGGVGGEGGCGWTAGPLPPRGTRGQSLLGAPRGGSLGGFLYSALIIALLKHQFISKYKVAYTKIQSSNVFMHPKNEFYVSFLPSLFLFHLPPVGIWDTLHTTQH